jgi:acylphosphatase
MNKTVSILVTGRVQGVWYRKYTMYKAIELGIKGYVRNMPDDSVYILATGTPEQLDALVQWCYIGSPKSKVEKVTVLDESFLEMNGFNIVR